jgi:hypothetical protein
MIVVSGSFGRCCYSTSAGDSEAAYFARFDSTSSGFTKVTLSSDGLDAQFVRSTGTLTDTFSIAGPGDADGDGFDAAIEAHVGTNTSDRCGDYTSAGPSGSWPADLAGGGTPDSTNRVNVNDITSFLAPVRRLDTQPGSPGYSVRWDLHPGSGQLLGVINIQDIAQLLIVAPAMFGGQRAFNGPACG